MEIQILQIDREFMKNNTVQIKIKIKPRVILIYLKGRLLLLLLCRLSLLIDVSKKHTSYEIGVSEVSSMVR